MDRELAIRGVGLYAPIVIALSLWVWRWPTVGERGLVRRYGAALLLAAAWNAVSLLILNTAAVSLGWWSFHADGGLISGVPVDLYLGWIVLWSVVPVLAFGAIPVAAGAVAMAALDLLLMPLCEPVIALGPKWYAGEAVAIVLAYVPSQYFARWTINSRRLEWRAVLQVVAFSGLILLVIPTVILEQTGGAWTAVRERSWILNNILIQLLVVPAILGFSAVQEFVQRGGGTPLPYDPPSRLVTTGPYAFVANPMQVSAALVFVIWGVVLASVWIVVAAAMTVFYSLGLAAWHERDHLIDRFGDAWIAYRRVVRAWRVRAKPYVAQPAVLYVADGCPLCRGVGKWIADRRPVGLRIVAAEEHPARTLSRMTYERCGGPADEGIAAFARALEHTHLGWAFVGMFIRLPIIKPFLQILVDASGGYPRTVLPRATAPRVP